MNVGSKILTAVGCGLWMAGSAVAAPLSETKAPAPAPALACPLDPGLEKAREACARDAKSIQCAFLASAEALLRDAPAESAAILEPSLPVDAESRRLLVPRLQLLSYALAAPAAGDPCLAGMVSPLMALTAAALEAPSETPAGKLFLAPLLYPLAPEDLARLEEGIPADVAAQVRQAREAFGSLLGSTAAGKEIRRGVPLAAALELLQKKALSPAR